jgi:dynein heavy chain
MPERDKFFTVQAHTIVREYLDYQHWYDRQKLTLKEIRNCQFVIAMNQNAGTFLFPIKLINISKKDQCIRSTYF